MKTPFRVFLLYLFFIHCSIRLSAQKQYIGIKAGEGPVSVMTAPETAHGITNGFCAGFTYHRVTKSRFTLGIELLYEKRGYGIRQFTGTLEKTQSNHYLPTYYNYFTTPVLIGYTFGNKFHVITSIGACPGILQSATTTNYFPENTGPHFDSAPMHYSYKTKTSDIKSNANSFNLSVLADITMGYQITKHFDLFISARCQAGVSSILKDQRNEMWNNDTYFCLGMRYCLTP